MEQFKEKRALRDWLLSDDTPKTKAATEAIFNKKNLTENMIESLNPEEDATVRELVGQYVEIMGDSMLSSKSDLKAKMRRIEDQVAKIMETAFDR
jgi:hypothetical protein